MPPDESKDVQPVLGICAGWIHPFVAAIGHLDAGGPWWGSCIRTGIGYTVIPGGFLSHDFNLINNIIYIYTHMAAVETQRWICLCSSPMSFLAFVDQVVGMAREAQSTNLWGLACPFHCGSSSLPSLLSAFLLGLVLGISRGGFSEKTLSPVLRSHWGLWWVGGLVGTDGCTGFCHWSNYWPYLLQALRPSGWACGLSGSFFWSKTRGSRVPRFHQRLTLRAGATSSPGASISRAPEFGSGTRSLLHASRFFWLAFMQW